MSNSDAFLADLDSYIEEVRTSWNNVGLSLAIVQGTEILCARGYGVREFGKAIPNTPDTLFQIGSTSKAFTTAALGVLVDEGKVNWDDPIADHLPEFDLQDPWLARNLTIRDAIAHRSGIADPIYFGLGVVDSHRALQQLLHAKAEGRFRDSFHYSNLMYAVAGKVVEAVSGVTWRAFVTSRLLQPLRMYRSGTSPYEFWDTRDVTATFLGSTRGRQPTLDDARDANVAMPHCFTDSGLVTVLPWQSYDNAAAAGAVVSSAADMANWLILHLNEGRFGNEQILQRETVQQLHATQNLYAGTEQMPFEGTTVTYAMGWWRADYGGHIHLAHSGSIIGFPSYVALLPGAKIGIVVLSNGPANLYSHTFLHRAIAFWVLDYLLGGLSRNWMNEFAARAKTQQRAIEQERAKLRQARLRDSAPSLPLERYEGRYQDQYRHPGSVKVCVEEGHLTLRFSGEGAFSAYLEPWHRDIFRLRPRAGIEDVLTWFHLEFVAFAINPLGRVGSLSAFGVTYYACRPDDERGPP